jgi:hypothetical protein
LSKVKGFVAATSVVDASKTSATQLVYDNADGSRTVKLSQSPVRFWDSGSKAWRDFDPSLQPDGDRLVGKALPEGAAVAASSGPESLLVSSPTTAGFVSLVNPSAAEVAAKVDGASATFPGALQGGGSIQVVLSGQGFESSVLAPSVSVGSSYVEDLVVPAGVSAMAADGGVRLVDAKGQAVGFYGGGFAQDSTGDRAEVVTSLVSQQAGTVEVREAVDQTWWADPGRVFPVTVDPIFVAQTTASGALDTYISSDAPWSGHASSTVVQVGHRSTGVDRGLLKWDLSGLAVPGQVVLSSQLWVNSVGGASCTARKMDVFNVSGTWGSGVPWATQPTVASSPLSSAWFAHGFSS